jgi:site-specific DNA-methyltransferase (adenine-specific)
MSADEIFDVAAERVRRLKSVQAVWTSKRDKLDVELQAKLAAALALKEPGASNAALREFEELLAKRKRATADANALELQRQAEAYFGTSRKYTIILADPPWRYKCTTHTSGTSTRYDTMSNEELAAMPVSGLAEPDAVLVMWATFHMLDAAVSLFNAWGFELLTILFVWVKVDRTGAPIFTKGSFTRPCAEFALMGTRGKSLQIRQRAATIGSILRSRPRKHSRKPSVVADMLARIFGDFPRIELFARRRLPDWDVWGNDIDRFSNEAEPEADGDGGGEADDGGADSDAEDADGFLPRKLNRVAQRRDRFWRVDVNGAAQSYSSVTTATSFGRLDHEFDGEESTPRLVVGAAAGEEHEHDGTRLCCRPLSELLEGSDALRNTTMMSAYLERRGGYEAMRNTLYTNTSEAVVRSRRDDILQQQNHNADVLFAVNYNSGKRAKPLVALTPSPIPKRSRTEE